jgi:hypothetical protein
MSEKKIEKEEEIAYLSPRAKAHLPGLGPAQQPSPLSSSSPAPPSCSVECHRDSRARRRPPSRHLPLPGPSTRPWRRTRVPRLHSSPPEPLPLTPATNPTTTERLAGARPCARAARELPGPSRRVQRAPRRRLLLRARGIGPGSPEHAIPFVFVSPDPQVAVVEYSGHGPSPTSPPPPLHPR